MLMNISFLQETNANLDEIVELAKQLQVKFLQP